MKLEELKVEADKLGYRLVKKSGKIKLLPCSCNNKTKPELWVDASDTDGGWFYKCDNCGKRSDVVKTRTEVKRAWNLMILEQGERDD